MIPARLVYVVVLRDKHLLCKTRCVLITIALDLLLARINLLHELDALSLFFGMAFASGDSGQGLC